MPELLKNAFTKKVITVLANEVSQHDENFERDAFIKSVFVKDWKNKELKQRIRHVSENLKCYLPGNYQNSLAILKPVSVVMASNYDDLVHLIFPDFVELCGLDDYDASVEAMAFFTSGSSSEFPIRHFIVKYENKMMQQMNAWSKSDDLHLRRLASEGCRPRLPWAIALPKFKKNPKKILPLLERLKNDESEYVRRSVANNLNDISKDNPDVVIALAKKWLGNTKETDWVVKHGCRTLLKQGEEKILTLFGFKEPKGINVKGFKVTKEIYMGAEIEIDFTLQTKNKKLGKLRLEYIVEFVRQNNKVSKKVFKISEGDYLDKERKINKKHSFKAISTRKYYAGTHGVSIVVNGKVLAKKNFLVKE